MTRTVPDFPVGRITFLPYARLMMTDEEITTLALFDIFLDGFHCCGT